MRYVGKIPFFKGRMRALQHTKIRMIIFTFTFHALRMHFAACIKLRKRNLSPFFNMNLCMDFLTDAEMRVGKDRSTRDLTRLGCDLTFVSVGMHHPNMNIISLQPYETHESLITTI